MATARQRTAWNHTASILAAVYALGGTEVNPLDIHPMAEKRKVATVATEDAKELFKQFRNK